MATGRLTPWTLLAALAACGDGGAANAGGDMVVVGMRSDFDGRASA